MTPPPATGPAFAAPAAGSADTVGVLISLLTAQRDHYRKLKTLSDRQQQLVADGQVESLLSVLAERQGHVDALTRLNEQLAPHRTAMTGAAEQAEPGQREQLRGLVDEVQTLLDQIIQQDDQDKEKLTADRDRVKTQVQKVNVVPAALAAYRGKATTPAARFADRKG
jgi:hypothetical protein